MTGQIIGQLILWLIAAVIVVFSFYWAMHWLYRRSTKEIAFVRTGFLGEKVVIDGGAFVWPIVHDVTPVNMNSMRLAVVREKSEALITKDRLRVDVEAEFYVRVAHSETAVGLAAATLGRRALEPERLHDLLSGKFVSAMRLVASEMTMEELHENRSAYAERVQQAVRDGLDRNGLELESIAITDIDQTDIEFFNPSNSFDAAGLTKVIEVTEERRKLRNDIEQDAAIRIRARNLEAEKQSLEIGRESEAARLTQERDIEFHRARQRADLAKERSDRETEAEQATLASKEAIERARIAQERAVTEERIALEQATREKEISRNLALHQAEVKSQEESEKLSIAQTKAVQAERIASERETRTLEIERQRVLDEARLAADEETSKSRIAQEERLRALEIERDKALQEAEIAASEAVDAARISHMSEKRRLEIARDRAIEEASMEKVIAISKKALEESAAAAAADAARARAATAAEKVATARETEATNRRRSVDVALAEKVAEEERIAAEAARVRAAVEGEAQKLINEAENVLTDDARQAVFKRKMLEHVEGIVAASVKPLEKIDEIKIMQLGGAGAGGFGDGDTSPIDEVINSALRYRVQGPMIDSLLADIGVDGSNLAKSSIIREAQDLARTGNEVKRLNEDDKGKE